MQTALSASTGTQNDSLGLFSRQEKRGDYEKEDNRQVVFHNLHDVGFESLLSLLIMNPNVHYLYLTTGGKQKTESDKELFFCLNLYCYIVILVS